MTNSAIRGRYRRALPSFLSERVSQQGTEPGTDSPLSPLALLPPSITRNSTYYLQEWQLFTLQILPCFSLIFLLFTSSFVQALSLISMGFHVQSNDVDYLYAFSSNSYREALRIGLLLASQILASSLWSLISRSIIGERFVIIYTLFSRAVLWLVCSSVTLTDIVFYIHLMLVLNNGLLISIESLTDRALKNTMKYIRERSGVSESAAQPPLHNQDTRPMVLDAQSIQDHEMYRREIEAAFRQYHSVIPRTWSTGRRTTHQFLDSLWLHRHNDLSGYSLLQKLLLRISQCFRPDLATYLYKQVPQREASALSERAEHVVKAITLSRSIAREINGIFVGSYYFGFFGGLLLGGLIRQMNLLTFQQLCVTSSISSCFLMFFSASLSLPISGSDDQIQTSRCMLPLTQCTLFEFLCPNKVGSEPAGVSSCEKSLTKEQHSDETDATQHGLLRLYHDQLVSWLCSRKQSPSVVRESPETEEKAYNQPQSISSQVSPQLSDDGIADHSLLGLTSSPVLGDTMVVESTGSLMLSRCKLRPTPLEEKLLYHDTYALVSLGEFIHCTRILKHYSAVLPLLFLQFVRISAEAIIICTMKPFILLSSHSTHPPYLLLALIRALSTIFVASLHGLGLRLCDEHPPYGIAKAGFGSLAVLSLITAFLAIPLPLIGQILLIIYLAISSLISVSIGICIHKETHRACFSYFNRCKQTSIQYYRLKKLFKTNSVLQSGVDITAVLLAPYVSALLLTGVSSQIYRITFPFISTCIINIIGLGSTAFTDHKLRHELQKQDVCSEKIVNGVIRSFYLHQPGLEPYISSL